MKDGKFGAVVTRRTHPKFDTGEQIQISLEDGWSFNIPVESTLARKIGDGDELTLTYTSKKSKDTDLKSGGVMTFTTMYGVEVLEIKKSQQSTRFQDLPDVDLPPVIDYTTGGSSSEKTDDKIRV